MSSSLFFDYPCKGGGAGERSVPTDLAWCRSENLLACAIESGRIAIYQDEGEEVPAASITRDGKQRASVMDWSPRGRLLAIGWTDGQVSTWSVMEPLQENASPCTSSNQGIHRQSVTVLLWNPSGTRLVTGDKAGIVCVWKADARGNMAPSVQYRRKNSAITAVVFCGGPSHPTDALAQAFSPSFFFSTEAGAVCYADDMGHCSEVQQLTSAVDRLVYYESTRRLVIITRSLLMTQLQVGEDGRVSQFMKVKLSVSGPSVRDSGLREVTWAGPGLLAAATGEGLVRFWDLSSDKNYVLTLQSGGLDRADKSACISFDPVRRYLAVGSTFGCVAIWKFSGEYGSHGKGTSSSSSPSSPLPSPSTRRRHRVYEEPVTSSRAGGPNAGRPASAESGGPSDWRALPPTTLDSVPVKALRWGAAGGVLGVLGKDMAEGAHILAETVLHRQLSGKIAVIQLESDTLSIEYRRAGDGGVAGGDRNVSGIAVMGAAAAGGRGGAGAAGGKSVDLDSSLEGEQVVRCDISIKGFHLQGDLVLVHNSKQAQLLKLRGAGLPPQKGDPWSCAARSVAVDSARDQVFVAAGSSVNIYNLQGGFKSALTFTEAEGKPTLVSLCGCFLAVATDKGSIKLYDVSKKVKVDASTLPVRPLGSTGYFVCPKSGESLGIIRSIRCNADGTRVSILSDKVHGQTLKIRSPDSRIHVYGTDKDAIESYDWGPEARFPTAHCWDPQEPRLLAVEARRLTGGDLVMAAPKKRRSSSAASVEEEKKDDHWEGHRLDDAVDDLDDLETKYGGDSEAAAAARSSARARAASLGDPAACEAEVTTLFVTSDFGVLMQDSFQLEEPLEALLGLEVPRLYFTAKAASNADEDDAEGSEASKGGNEAAREQMAIKKSRLQGQRPVVMSRAMRDFVGLDQVDERTTAALLDFSLHLTVGDMDKAYAAVRLIKSTTVWENMAHMCVKTRRLDVAELCLGNMGHARGAASVRLAKQEPEPEVAVAQVATQLGLLDDGVRLYRECGRYDLLNRLYQAAGLWERALRVAEEHDVINLTTTHHLFAQHLEKVGDTAGAIRHYELAGTHCAEVPRMLFERNRVEDLEDYITQGDNAELLKWWSQYLESRGEFEKARQYYARAKDFLSLVRLACHAGDVNRATEIVHESGSAPAAYHLARHLEAVGRTAEAVSFYARSSRFNHAIRLAKDHDMDSELMGFALKSTPNLMISVAEHLESKGELEKAVQLYQKAGDVARALELCFRAGGRQGEEGRECHAGMFDTLKAMADDLGTNASPQVLSRCVDFFIDNGQFGKAVDLCIRSRRYIEAIELCLSHKVPISEEMAEELTPPKETANASAGSKNAVREEEEIARHGDARTGSRENGGPGDDASGNGNGGGGDAKLRNTGDTGVSQDERQDILRELAKACRRQGNFHLACKKYTQAGDRLKAMKSLLESGDTKSIIYYAGVSRSREIYVLAANYLQNLDWHDDPQVMKSIIAFYGKAKAYVQLSGFYDACAQVEIDEYRDYEKALGALNEAWKQLAKAGPQAEKLAQLKQKIFLVERFVQARQIAKEDPDAMVTICQQLLANGELESAMRAGDCYAALVDHFFDRQDWQQCYSLITRMRDRGIALDPYLDHGVLLRVSQEVGISLEELGSHDSGARQGNVQSDAEDEVGEDIPMEEEPLASDEDEERESPEAGVYK